MKTIYLAAALALASSAAHAGSTIAFDFDGHKIRVTVPSNCQSLSCLQISGVNLNSLKSGKIEDDDDAPVTTNTASNAPATATAPAASSAAAAAAAQPMAQSQAPIAAPAAQAATSTNPPVAQEPVTMTTPAPASASASSTIAAAASAPAAAPAPVAAAAPDPNSPLGLWATEDNKGNVRIEPCGQNICGYAEKSGEKILINMKPKENKWVGRIHDPDGGSNYDSTIALKGPNTLKVQGCAFGGLFCGGQTWKRVS